MTPLSGLGPRPRCRAGATREHRGAGRGDRTRNDAALRDRTDPEFRVPGRAEWRRDVRLVLDPQPRGAVYHPEDPATRGGRRDDHLHRVRRRVVDPADLGVLTKCDWPKIRLNSSGFSIVTNHADAPR